jgi:hypothetical protein
MTLQTIFRMGTSSWGLTGGSLALLALPAYRLAAWRWRTRKLLAIQLRLEIAWQNTRAALIAAQIAGGKVLSESAQPRTPQRVQQNRISCDI